MPDEFFAGPVKQAGSRDFRLATGEWTDQKNARRCELIDKQIQNEITAEEAEELAGLTRQLRAHMEPMERARVEETRQLHAELLRKKAQRNRAKKQS